MTVRVDTELLWVRGSKPLCYACERGLTGQEKTCYACLNGLTGEPKGGVCYEVYDVFDDHDEDDDEVWACWCHVWECRCDMVARTAELGWCPVCRERFHGSKYLADVFADDERTRWLANLVTHYRHRHRCWDRQHRWIDGHCRPGVYDAEKQRVNEQIKRALIRKYAGFLKTVGITAEHFAVLAETTAETLDLARKHLATP